MSAVRPVRALADQPTIPPYVPDPEPGDADRLARLDALLETGVLDERLPELLAGRDEVKRIGYAEGVAEGREQGAAYWPMIDEEGYRRGYAAARHHIAARLKDRARTDPHARTLLLDLLDE